MCATGCERLYAICKHAEIQSRLCNAKVLNYNFLLGICLLFVCEYVSRALSLAPFIFIIIVVCENNVHNGM